MFSAGVYALWISSKIGLPTINGLTGTTPPNYKLDDLTIDYAAAALQWITQNRPDYVCVYNRASRQWSPVPGAWIEKFRPSLRARDGKEQGA